MTLMRTWLKWSRNHGGINDSKTKWVKWNEWSWSSFSQLSAQPLASLLKSTLSCGCRLELYGLDTCWWPDLPSRTPNTHRMGKVFLWWGPDCVLVNKLQTEASRTVWRWSAEQSDAQDSVSVCAALKWRWFCVKCFRGTRFEVAH